MAKSRVVTFESFANNTGNRKSGVGNRRIRFPTIFIALEGPEGSGKTSHIPPLVEYLRDKGYIVFLTREPGGLSID